MARLGSGRRSLGNGTLARTQPAVVRQRFLIENRAIDGIDGNLSGLDFDRDRNALLAVINRPAELIVLYREGRLLRRDRLQGTSNVEALASVGNGQVALLQ